MKPTTCATEYFGGNRQHHVDVIRRLSLRSASVRNTLPRWRRSSPHSTFRRYFGMNNDVVTARSVSVGLTSAAILSKGAIRQKERWALDLLTLNNIGAWAITEPGRRHEGDRAPPPSGRSGRSRRRTSIDGASRGAASRRFYCPAAIIQARSVSTDSTSACSSVTFWCAKVGPKSAYRSRTSAIAWSRVASARRRPLGRPRGRDARLAAPCVANASYSRRTWRSLSRKSSAARRRVSRRSAMRVSTCKRSSSVMLSETCSGIPPLWTKSGHLYFVLTEEALRASDDPSYDPQWRRNAPEGCGSWALCHTPTIHTTWPCTR